MELNNLLCESPLSLKEIAKKFNCNISTLRTIMRNNKITLPQKKRYRAKIKASDIIIISLMIDKFSASVIAKRIGCSQRTIQRYIKMLRENRNAEETN